MQLLNDILAGKRVEVKVGEGAFWRTFGGDQSPEDLETALQLVYRLFTSTVVPDPVKLATCLRCDPAKMAHSLHDRSPATRGSTVLYD